MRLDDIPCESLNACSPARYLKPAEQGLSARSLLAQRLAALSSEIDLSTFDAIDDDWLVW